MELPLTPQWFAELRRDLENWDIRFNEARGTWEGGKSWEWLDMRPLLRHPGYFAQQEPRRRRRAVTCPGCGRYPSSEAVGRKGSHDGRVTMQMRLPVHVWAMLTQGRVAESVEPEKPEYFVTKGHGIGVHEVWREYDGERHPGWRDREGVPRARQWTERPIQRLQWLRRNGSWYPGEWEWEAYEQSRWHDAGSLSASASHALWGNLPQEVLLGMIHDMDSDACDKGLLPNASRVCRAWFAICAPEMYFSIFVHSSRVQDLIRDLLLPDSRIAQFAEWLYIRGPIPWMLLTQLLVALPRTKFLEIKDEAKRIGTTTVPVYHSSIPRLSFGVQLASQTVLSLTAISIGGQCFKSAVDVLWLLGRYPHLSSARLGDCDIENGTATTAIMVSTHLTSVSLWKGLGNICDKAISTLAQWWQWPHGADDSLTNLYPGLHRADIREAVAIIGLVAFTAFGWEGISFSLEESPCAGAWVLLVEIASSFATVTDRNIELEFHVTCDALEGVSHVQGQRAATVKHAVIRVSTTREFFGSEYPYPKLLQAMDERLTRLPDLRTVTLETTSSDDCVALRNNLALMDVNGKLRLRTCKEAQQVAQAAFRNPSRPSIDQSVISPLWYSKKHSDRQREEWLRNDAEAFDTVSEYTSSDVATASKLADGPEPNTALLDAVALSESSASFSADVAGPSGAPPRGLQQP